MVYHITKSTFNHNCGTRPEIKGKGPTQHLSTNVSPLKCSQGRIKLCQRHNVIELSLSLLGVSLKKLVLGEKWNKRLLCFEHPTLHPAPLLNWSTYSMIRSGRKGLLFRKMCFYFFNMPICINLPICFININHHIEKWLKSWLFEMYQRPQSDCTTFMGS